ncbi:LacI family transcriptional regulator [Wenyingzhuangia heitensis]|uniref:LacI family transcriptional regulator n=1 Tax=Wenyingzhuangia heitensis TaxID=1487859 RepID=A0ABX0UFP3_9FLAO|nr:substrate-binding domain-containing protein [Wenyingzhuangia heitensis]NIJ46241.1 LacI family transcriptional regulator [Wenyingzhuangia heitensis]
MNRIKDIAKKANVSAGTVDRVLHNRGGVSEKTRAKILKIIEDSNYSVNPVASILASKKKFSIATLLPHPKTNTDFWDSPKQGVINASKEIKSLGFEVNNFEFDQFDATSYITAFHKMINSEPNAVLLAPLLYKETLELVKHLDAKQIPYVTINSETEGINNLSFIGQNSFKGGFLAGKLFNWVLPKKSEVLIVEIRKNIANYTAINNRIEGFKTFFNQSKKAITVNRLSIKAIDNQEQLNLQLKKYLNKNPSVKGIFVPSSKVSMIAKSMIEIDREDIELGGFDSISENIKYLKNGIVDFLISQKAQQQGYDGIKLLFNYLIHKKEPAKNYYLPIEIVLKENVDFL